MQFNALSNGYSSSVSGWLVVDGHHYGLSQVGPGFCILQNPKSLPKIATVNSPAELIVKVDDDQQTTSIRILNETGPNQRILFDRV